MRTAFFPWTACVVLLLLNSGLCAEYPLWFDQSKTEKDRFDAVRKAPKDLIDAYGPEGYTGLMLAAWRGDVTLATLFLDRGADVHKKAQNKFGDTALHVAVSHSDDKKTGPGSYEIAQLLLDKGALVNATNARNEQPIHKTVSDIRKMPSDSSAAQEDSLNRMKVIDMLVKRGADINAQGFKGYTLLHQAVAGGDYVFINAIKEAYPNTINMNIKDVDGLTPYEYAKARARTDVEDNDPVIVALNKPLGRIDTGYFGYKRVDEQGRTALMFAVIRNNKEQATEYIKQGASINDQDKDGMTALHYAVRSLHPVEFVKMLLDKGATVNTANNEGDTPLHLVVNITDPSRRIEVAKLLASKGAYVNAPNKKGETVLHRAVQLGDVQLVDYITNELVKLAKNKDGKTPHDLATAVYKTSQGADPKIKASLEKMIKILAPSSGKN
jgi:ankyrin repeat protein